ncbi:MAG: cytochrome c3 family protein [Deltaproteobacteria bacterium]|nr:cytochrome c3 family protein [Deltaproteobacteria bacterium]
MTGRGAAKYFFAQIIAFIAAFHLFYIFAPDTLAVETIVVDALGQCEPFDIQAEEAKKPASDTAKEDRAENEKKNAYLNAMCSKCHQPVYDELKSFTRPHSDVVPKNCAACHLVLQKKEKNVEKNYRRIANQSYGKEFLAPIGSEKDEKKICLKVKLTNKNENSAFSGFQAVTPSGVKSDLKNDGKPPVISDLRVADFKPGVFDDVDISWKTDKFSGGVIKYGNDANYGEKAGSENTLLKEHTVMLKSLKHNTAYRYKGVSNDPFGNITESGSQFYTNEKKISAEKAQKLLTPPVIEKIGAVKLKDNVFIYIKADQDVRYDVDYVVLDSEEKQPALAALSGSPENLLSIAHGDGFETKKNVAIKNCKRCHKKSVDHPTNIRAVLKKGANLPLTDGVITCATCHTPHGGNESYFLRMGDPALCNMCHTNIGG